MSYITTQKKLAEIVGCDQSHLCRIKTRKYTCSEKLAEKLSEVTGISLYDWVKGSKRSLNRQLKDFFLYQKLEKFKKIQK